MMKALIKYLLIIGVFALAVYLLNMPGIGGQVAHSPNQYYSAWLSHRGWAGVNGKYVVVIVDNETSLPVQRYVFKCTTSHFAQMRDTDKRYLSWDEERAILYVRLPNEMHFALEINKHKANKIRIEGEIENKDK